MSQIVRETSETRVGVSLQIESVGEDAVVTCDTGVRFLDHMLTALARYGGFGLQLDATFDLKHHLIEDVAITLGLALKDATPPACRRYATVTVPMDDALVEVSVDLGGRSYYEGPLPARLYDHFMRSLAENARYTLHVRVLRGEDRHHVVEAAFKALGLALREALAPTGAVFSTKGAVSLTRGGES